MPPPASAPHLDIWNCWPARLSTDTGPRTWSFRFSINSERSPCTKIVCPVDGLSAGGERPTTRFHSESLSASSPTLQPRLSPGRSCLLCLLLVLLLPRRCLLVCLKFAADPPVQMDLDVTGTESALALHDHQSHRYSLGEVFAGILDADGSNQSHDAEGNTRQPGHAKPLSIAIAGSSNTCIEDRG